MFNSDPSKCSLKLFTDLRLMLPRTSVPSGLYFIHVTQTNPTDFSWISKRYEITQETSAYPLAFRDQWSAAKGMAGQLAKLCGYTFLSDLQISLVLVKYVENFR